MSEIRCIGICTGGGDAPGLNAVIRAAVKSAILKYKWKVIGIPDGFDGLIWPEKSHELTLKDVSGILPRGGTILGTGRLHPDDFMAKIEEVYAQADAESHDILTFKDGRVFERHSKPQRGRVRANTNDKLANTTKAAFHRRATGRTELARRCSRD